MLGELPTELLDQIITYLPTAQSVSNLSQASRNIHSFVEKEGWRTFSQSRFPDSEFPPYWKDASRALITLSRNWDRRAFIARYIEPSGRIRKLPGGHEVVGWRRPKGQTMGFQPAIDSYEQFVGARWTDRREVVAWSAGAELVVRVKAKDKEVERNYRDASREERMGQYDLCGNSVRWWTYKPLSSVEGRDDITSVNILKPQDLVFERNAEVGRGESIVISTANGDLQRLEIPPGPEESVVKQYFVTNGSPVRSASVSPVTAEGGQTLVANLSETRIALYPIDGMTKTAAVSNINAIPRAKRGCRIWSTKFLDTRHIAVGLGPSVEPLHVYEVRPDCLSDEPIRKFGLVDDFDDRVDFLGAVKPSSSVYPTLPLPDSNGVVSESNVFLSGAYDGIVRLHDMRSPSSVETSYNDPTDDSAVYSLLTRGRDKLIAGTARHSLLKVFDLRMTGGRNYDNVNINKPYQAPDAASNGNTDMGGDWNLFINPRDQYSNSSWRGPNSWMRRSAESSIYSLSSPSPLSPFIFAGVENAVVEFNFSAALDRYPDPICSPNVRRDQLQGRVLAKGQRVDEALPAWVGYKGDVLNLAMYAQGTEGGEKEAMKLKVQRSIEDTAGKGKQRVGLDERWREAGDS